MHYLIALLLAFSVMPTGDVPVSTPLDHEVTEWKLSKDKKGVKVYTRSVKESNIKEFRAITVVSTSMKTLVGLMNKVSEFPNWQSNITSATLLKQVNKNERYTYNTMAAPWPIIDRDVILYSKRTRKDGAVTYSIKSAPDYMDAKDGFIRVKVAKGKWRFIPKEGGKIKVIYQFYGDPEGRIPSWLINLFLVEGPYKTLVNLREVIAETE